MKDMKVLFKSAYVVFGICVLGLGLMLIGNVFPVFGYQTMVVTSGSMEPAIRTGSAVVVSDQETYVVGDVVTFYERGKESLPTTHRIVSERIADGTVLYTTKGDANDDVDQREIRTNDVIGRVVAVAPGIGYLLSMAKTWVGFLVLIGIPFVLVAIEEITKIRKAVEETKKV